MQYLKSEISAGYAINAAFMNYAENETIPDALKDNPRWRAFREEYNRHYEELNKVLGKAFPLVDSLLNSLRVMHDLESELFYRIGIHDGVSFCSSDFIFQNLGGAQ